MSFVADLTDEQQVEEFVNTVKKRTNRIDILVNNAGMAKSGKQPGSGNLETLTLRGMARTIGDDAEHGVSDDPGGFAGDEATEVRTHRERVVRDRANCQECWLGRIWSGEGRTGRNDARGGVACGGCRDHD